MSNITQTNSQNQSISKTPNLKIKGHLNEFRRLILRQFIIITFSQSAKINLCVINRVPKFRVFTNLQSFITQNMEPRPNKAHSFHSRTNSENSCSSLSSFADDIPKKKKKIDRMIYSVDKADFQWSENKARKKSLKHKLEKATNSPTSPQQTNFEDYLSDNLSQESESFKDFYSKTIKKAQFRSANKRTIPQAPFKQTKFKYWRDNFYTNLLDWNFNNIIFAGADSQIHQYNLSSFDSRQPKIHSWLYEKGSKINSIKCSPTNNLIGVAYESGTLRVYDYSKERNIHVNILHSARITALEWNQRTILTGSKDRTISMLDERTFKHGISISQIHTQEVLGVKRCGDLIATGGNDNMVAIFDVRKPQKCIHSYMHDAAVKALAWIQEDKILMSGGGTSDKMIKMWNFKKNQMIREIQTGSQVCSIVVSKNTKQFVSCQGFSQNQVVLWNYEGKRIQTFHGKHSSRVLYSALSPSGEYLATGAGDTNLLVWKMFPTTQRRNRLIESSDLR